VTTPRKTVGLLATGVALAGAVLGGCALPTQSTTTNGTSQPMSPSSVSNAQSATPTSSTTDTQASASSQPTRPQQTGQQTTNPPTTRPDPSTRCHTSMLAATLQYAGAGAGQRQALLTLRNISGQTCTLYGYAGLQLLGAAGNPLPTNLQREASTSPTLLRLAPGASATADLQYAGIPANDEPGNSCEPQPATVLVTPPDERDPLTASWGHMDSACQHGAMHITPFHQPTNEPLPQQPQ
jgi:hypothetical protein